MVNMISKIFGHFPKNNKTIPTIYKQTCKNIAPAQQQVASTVASTSEGLIPSLGLTLSCGKRYYGVIPGASPTVKRGENFIEKSYPCADGGEVVVNYVTAPTGKSSLSIVKVGNPKDQNKGGWYRAFFSDHFVKRQGLDEKVVNEKWAIKQRLSGAPGRTTEEVKFPLKRWVKGIGKRVDNKIDSFEPNDFARYSD